MAVFNGLFAKNCYPHYAIRSQHQPTPLWVHKKWGNSGKKTTSCFFCVLGDKLPLREVDYGHNRKGD